MSFHLNRFLIQGLVCAATILAATSSVSAEALSTFGDRTYLCVKRVGKTADGSKNRGRDAYMNPKPCPRGYYTIDTSGFGTNILETGPQGEKGPVGPQGIPGPVGGALVGRLVACNTGESSGSIQDVCEGFGQQSEAGGFEVDIPGESFASRVDKECKFRLRNIPEGVYDLAISYRVMGQFVRAIKAVAVNEGTTTNLGDIPVCADADDDGFDQNSDCNDFNKNVNPGAQEICEDESDNNCNGMTNEGCSSSSSSGSSSSAGPS